MVGFIRAPGREEKLDILAAGARHDVCLASCNGNLRGGTGRFRDPAHPAARWIYPAHVPGRGRVGFLKVLLTNVCRNRCSYCHLTTREDGVPRLTFAPDELAGILIELARRRLVHGLFLSSALGHDPEATMERMVATADILRRRMGYGGYIHLKILPGASLGLIERAAALADRISINLEAPTDQHLKRIAPEKDLAGDLLPRMAWAGQLLRRGARARSQTTQFVVGAAGESDRDVLQTVDRIYRDLNVFRAYYSAFQPTSGPGPQPAPDGLPSPLLREHRLYQSDYLLRFYGFRLDELVFDRSGGLPSRVDPKSAWALTHPQAFPLEINRATEGELLRVPGIGPVSARRIVQTRRRQPLRGLADLRAAGAVAGRAASYVEFFGRREASRAAPPDPHQLRLFD
jgi:predicted DNA-binding helix-hairpin-helix protein